MNKHLFLPILILLSFFCHRGHAGGEVESRKTVSYKFSELNMKIFKNVECMEFTPDEYIRDCSRMGSVCYVEVKLPMQDLLSNKITFKQSLGEVDEDCVEVSKKFLTGNKDKNISLEIYQYMKPEYQRDYSYGPSQNGSGPSELQIRCRERKYLYMRIKGFFNFIERSSIPMDKSKVVDDQYCQSKL